MLELEPRGADTDVYMDMDLLICRIWDVRRAYSSTGLLRSQDSYDGRDSACDSYVVHVKCDT